MQEPVEAENMQKPIRVDKSKRTIPVSPEVVPEPRTHYAKHTVAMGADLYLSERQHPDERLVKLRAIAP